jgi:hypothetical protein
MACARDVLDERDQPPVSLTPRYASEVMIQLEKVEQDSSRSSVWDAICDAIDLVCDHPESVGARRYMWRRRDGGPVWQVLLKSTGEDDDWIVLWYQEGGEANIVYIGPDI